jgi:UDP-N-acetylmuramyl pentapeptide phosphotransferase/UDP-N-acetylglucosamine-1-phosphate transferase
MNGPWSLHWWLVAGATLALSALVTWNALLYARRRNLLDRPGPRRSHSVPTPRGGGIGIVVAVVAALVFAIVQMPGDAHIFAHAIMAIVIVAAVGWIDDHRSLAARWRLLAHFVAAVVLLLPLHGAPHAGGAVGSTAAAVFVCFAVAVIACAWSINLHNFMDGINGILALQAIFVFCALALCDVRGFDTPYATLLVLWTAATLAFVPFNFPRARIFMGDVGSGVLGLLVATAVIWQIEAGGAVLATGIIACSAFVTDATCTLLSRMVRGRRWYGAHREHLYQWLARSGFSHAGVVALYMGWNLFVVAPVLYLANRDHHAPLAAGLASASPDTGVGFAIAIYALGVAVWVAGKRWCPKKVKML